MSPPVHPHVRGEQSEKQVAKAGSGGSSPRARGAERDPDRHRCPRRFIPTCAGSSSLRDIPRGMLSVHPHVRGEQGREHQYCVRLGGSSPRARGAVTLGLRHTLDGRFIPTCAGSRRTRATTAARSAVHPHVRGEQSITLSTVTAGVGSSPRARGAVDHGGHVGLGLRFIPTCAGSSIAQYSCTRPDTVHPHVRGEQLTALAGRCLPNGSSPRARGAVHPYHLPPGSQRFIPTCAGSRCGTSPLSPRRPVHPHVRGEQPDSASAGEVRIGSSPRARGAV